MKNTYLTLDEFTIQQLRLFPGGTGELSHLLRDIGLAAKRINAEVSKAGLVDILGDTDTVNVQGETVKRLDDFANRQLIIALKGGMSCAGLCTEEEDEIVVFDDPLNNNSKYVVLVDPLDGSSNIDVNISIGTVFSIYRRTTPAGVPCRLEDFLQPGRLQVAAGYVIYGPSTMLVYATRLGVNGFTLDPVIGEFCLSHPDMRCDEHGRTFSVNMANFAGYPVPVQTYIASLQQSGDCTFRYTGSMIADLHRNLLKGGIFLYPPTTKQPGGKLRLMYECKPFAYIYDKAGGLATNGEEGILDLAPTGIHQRSPLYIGNRAMMGVFGC